MSHITPSRKNADKASKTVTAKDKAAGAKTAVEKAKAPVAKKADAPKVTETFTVASLCKASGQDPKTVRSRLRRLYAKDDANKLPQPVKDAKQRWTFAEANREAVVAMIASSDDEE